MQLELQSRASALRRQRGATLLEVLVSMLLMSFGMLALAGMQAYSVARKKMRPTAPSPARWPASSRNSSGSTRLAWPKEI
jgi:Tfp pilus assembly protein PilW